MPQWPWSLTTAPPGWATAFPEGWSVHPDVARVRGSTTPLPDFRTVADRRVKRLTASERETCSRRSTCVSVVRRGTATTPVARTWPRLASSATSMPAHRPLTSVKRCAAASSALGRAPVGRPEHRRCLCSPSGQCRGPGGPGDDQGPIECPMVWTNAQLVHECTSALTHPIWTGPVATNPARWIRVTAPA